MKKPNNASDTRRTLNLRSEKRELLLLDIIVNIICGGVVTVCSFLLSDLTLTKCFGMSLASMVLVMFFMVALEEYKPTITVLQERQVTIVLSVLYSFVLTGAVHSIFFQSLLMFLLSTAWFVFDIALMLLGNVIFYNVLSDSKRFRKLRLIVIADKNGELPRLKRVKYGVLSRYDSWYESIDSDNAEEVEKLLQTRFEDYDSVCVFDNIKDDVYDKIVNQAMRNNKDVFAIPRMIDINRGQANVLRFDDVPAVYIQRYELSPVEEFFKRAIDIVIGVIALILAAIPMGIIALLIKITSPGPVFYRQERYTRNKRVFKIIKFRTMVPNAEKLTGPVFAQKDDPRITPIGKILRACRLDELPQIFNILSGDMSIVGPRPERPFFVEQFEQEIENYDYRFVVKAGLTSLSHVYGRYSTYIHDRTCYDLLYISNYSLMLDLKIILLTTKTMFVKTAAEGEDEFKVSANGNSGEAPKPDNPSIAS